MLRSGVLLLLCLAMLGGQNGVPEHGALLVANKGDHALGIVDPVSGRQVATVPEDGVTGHEVTASPDGAKAYVPSTAIRAWASQVPMAAPWWW